MAKIRQSNLDNSIVTGLGELTSVASGDQTIVYDASTGTLKKISQTNFLNFPTVTSVSPTSVSSGDGTGNHTFTITGSGFTSGTADLINNSGTTISFDTVTIDSDTQITGVVAKSSLPSAGEPYDVRVTSTNGLRATLENQINIDQSPTFVTASGSIGSDRFSMTGVSVNATDPESAGNVTFELQSGALPPGITLTNTAADGGTATFTGTFSSLASSDTIYNFTLRAVDAASNTSSRAFSFTAQGPQIESFTSSGTFSVSVGLTSVDVLVVGGGGAGGAQHSGGGGAGGLVFVPGFPVTPGGTISVTVGCGGTFGTSSGCMPGQDSVFGTLTAKGGGRGGSGPGHAFSCTSGACMAGGSGGGMGYAPAPAPTTGNATQPTQPGQSGAYGFGNPGGTSPVPYPSAQKGGGGGGGAGAAGGNATPSGSGGPGGAGKAYTIADGTTPVYYAGGGGGSNHISPSTAGTGGQGGGGTGGIGPVGQNGAPPSAAIAAQPGQANKGGGGGGAHYGSDQINYANVGTCQAQGGKGIVIVKY